MKERHFTLAKRQLHNPKIHGKLLKAPKIGALVRFMSSVVILDSIGGGKFYYILGL